MEVVTFASDDHGSVARIRVPMVTAKGKTKLDWLPVAIHRPTCAEARQAAEDFYRSEQERLSQSASARETRLRKMAEARKAKAVTP